MPSYPQRWVQLVAGGALFGSASLPIYHAIVKSIARKNLLRVNQKDYEAFLKDCAPDIYHRFSGEHALGGERHDREAVRKWFERLGRLFPALELTVHDVWVKGWPNDTTVVIRWTSTDTFPDGSTYNNHGVHIVRMKWGKAVEIDANEDSQIVVEFLKACAEAGIEEAAAPPILS